MRKERKNYTPEEKVAILRRHLIEKVPVSALCEGHQLQPTVFYQTARSNAGISPSKPSASALTLRSPSTMPRRLVSRYVDHYNTVRLHRDLGYVTPQAMSKAARNLGEQRWQAGSRPERQRRRSSWFPLQMTCNRPSSEVE